MKKLFALLLVLTMVFALVACGQDSGKEPSDSDKPGTSQTDDPGKSEGNDWFSDEVMTEMKLTGFTKPAGFELVGDEDLPDAKENDPYYRELTGASDHEEYKPLIEQVYGILKENYGEVYDTDVTMDADGLVTEYIPMTEVMYGTAFYVKDGDVVRGVDLGYSSGYDADTKVLRIHLWPDVDAE